MNTNYKLLRRIGCLSSALVLLMMPPLAPAASTTPAGPGPTEIDNEPLAQAVSSVEPNIMFILDASGSMAWDYTPDYITTNSATTSRNCRDQADGTGNLPAALTECYFGDVPFNAYEFNTQYYNPNVYYRPSPSTGGVDQATRDMNRSNTSTWSAINNDAYGIATGGLPGVSGTTINLTNQVPRRVWCKTPSDDPNSTDCRENADHSYPNAIYKYGVDPSGGYKYRYGAPYYYRVSQAQYCTNKDKTTCQTNADANYTVRAPVRFCQDNSLSSCKAKRANTGTTYTYPFFAGQLSSGNFSETLATATITVYDSKTDNPVSIPQIYAGSTPLMANSVTANNGTNDSSERSSVARAIRDAINALSGTHGYTAVRNNEVVTITAPVGSGDTLNGVSLQPAIIAGSAAASVQLTFGNATASKSSDREFYNLQINGVPITSSSRIALPQNNPAGSATLVAAAINSYTNTNPWEYTATVSPSNAAVVIISAPVSYGSVPNGLQLTYDIDNNVSVSPSSGSNSAKLSGGLNGNNIPITTTSFTGGVAPTGSAGYWTSTIQFERVEIVPESAPSIAKTFPRGAEREGRVDCANASYCTYDEEMTNYANWYTYYRTRMQAAKSSSGRAFAGLSDNMRVGFITINPGSPVASSKYLKINNFTYDSNTATGHKKDWYDKLYSTNPTGGTPLREALSRVGRLYAGLFDGINTGIPSADDPVQYACQPNFAILTTDGYWNGNGGKSITLSGNSYTAIGDEDNSDSGFSKRIDGAYDGNLGASGTLADVAMYYYKNDLRSNMADTVFTTNKDTAQHQHMTTFTVGLGLSGELDYTTDYETQGPQKPGDFYAIKQGTKNWPVPVADSETALDDLWHAAVNGRGTFYSAANPQDFQNGLGDALTQMYARSGAGSAAATSNLQPTAGDNFAFTAEYETQSWMGDLVARTIDTTTGDVSVRTLWSAGTLLNQRNYMDRVIYTYDPSDTTYSSSVVSSGNKLKHFCWPNSTDATCTDGSGLTPTEQGYFNPTQLGQYAGWPSNKQNAATASSLFAFVRGDRTLETTGGNTDDDLYRSRKSVLGDIINAQPAYIKASQFDYSDPFYQTFKTNSKSRRGTVYAAANDGMLHAFETDVNNNAYYQTAGIATSTDTDDTFTGNNSGNGQERWAYVPGILLSKLYKLGDDPYTHRFFADGSPVIGDVCAGHTTSNPCASVNDWHTILVAGLNSGGRGYYALDITDPLAPKALWEFTATSTCLTDLQANSGTYSSDCNLGLSYGNPLIVKRPSDDRWVVIVTSGYNNLDPGDGRGYLYILDAMTGKILKRLTTGVGDKGTQATFSDANPSGLGRINAWATNAIENNQALTVYGGDLLGNMWRFDLATDSVTLLTTLKNSSGTVQPITTKPELGEVPPYRIVLVGTGRYLGSHDPSNLSVQTIYGLRDDNSGGTISGRTDMLPRVLTTQTTTTRTATAATTMNWINYKGWYADLPDSGERVNVDPQLQLGTLIIASNVPSTDRCQAGGYAWLNYFDYKQGTGTGEKIGNAMVVGLSTIKLSSGTVHTIVTTADNKRTTVTPPVSTTAFAGRRVSWREIITE